MSITTAKLVLSEKNNFILAQSWGYTTAVLSIIYFYTVSADVLQEDMVFFILFSILSVILPFALLQCCLKSKHNSLVSLYLFLSYFNIVTYVLQCMYAIATATDIGDICHDCFCSNNQTCVLVDNNNSVFEVNREDCQNQMLSTLFFILIFIAMIVSTMQTVYRLKIVIHRSQTPIISIVTDPTVPDIEENRYIPPEIEHKSNVPFVETTTGDTGATEGIAVGIVQS